MVEFGHAAGERFHFFLDGVEIVENGDALVEHRATGHGEAVLREVSGGDAFGARDRAVVEGFQTGQDLHDRGFASAVGPDQTDARLGRDQPVGVLEQQFVAVALAGAGKLDHGLVYLSSHDGK